MCLVSDIPGIEMSTTKIFIEDDEGGISSCLYAWVLCFL